MRYLHQPDGQQRACGDCTACCTALGVDELKKPLWAVCEHVCVDGCGIYEARPASCRGFECLWLKGWFGLDQHRPDKLGLIFQMQRDRKLGPILVCWESWPLAASKDPGRWILDRLSKQRYVYIYPWGEQKHRVIVGPKIEQLKRAVQ